MSVRDRWKQLPFAVRLAIILGVAALGIPLGQIVGHSIRQSTLGSEPVQCALALARESALLKEQLGEPLSLAEGPYGRISVHDDEGDADCKLVLRGPRGSADLHLLAVRAESVWTLRSVAVRLADGEVTELVVPRVDTPHEPKSNPNAPVQASLQIRLDPEARSIPAGGALRLKATVVNTGPVPVSVDESQLWRYVNFEQLPSADAPFGGGGQSIGDHAPGEGRASKQRLLKPNESFNSMIDIAERLGDLIGAPGEYRVWVEYCVPIGDSGNSAAASDDCLRSTVALVAVKDSRDSR